MSGRERAALEQPWPVLLLLYLLTTIQLVLSSEL